MNTFIKDSRKHLNQNNIDVKEGSPYPRIRIEPHPPEKIKLNIKKRKVMLLNREKTKKRKVKPN